MTPHVSTRWPNVVDSWFRHLLRHTPIDAPTPLSRDIWQNWLTAVHHHTLVPLLYEWLHCAPASVQPPAWVMEELQTEFWASKGYVVHRWAQMQRVLQLLSQAAVPAIVLKGAALAEFCYPKLELRPSLDIDILIPQTHYPQAKNALLAAGYQPQIEVPTAARQWACEEAFLPTQTAPGHAFLIELHWSLSPYGLLIPQPPLAGFFERAVPTRTGNSIVPSHLDALVHAALHLAYGHPEEVRLIWLYDIHLLAQQLKTADWPQVLEISQQWQARIALVDALQLAQQWFATPYPDIVTDLGQFPPTAQEQKIRDLAFYRIEYGPQFARLQRHWHQWGQLGRRERLQMAYYRLFPAREAIHIGYPQWRGWPLPLIYLARFFLLLRRLINQKTLRLQPESQQS